MKFFKMAWYGVLTYVLLQLVACDNRHDTQTEVEVAPESVKVMEALDSIDPEDFRKGRVLGDRIRGICNLIQTVPDAQERLNLLLKTAQKVDSMTFSGYSYREMRSMKREYLLMYEALAYALVENKVEESMVENFILSGFEKYKNMCFTLGGENDMSDGNSRSALERRRMAKTMRLAWMDDAGFFEQRSIRTIFFNNPKAIERFTKRWLEMFGHNGVK